MKKRIPAFILAGFMALSLAACGTTPASTAPPPASQPAALSAAPSGEKVVIKFAAQGDSTPATQAVLDAFNASQDQYTAEWMDMTNDSGAMREQLITSLKAGSADYDVVSLDVVWAGEFAAAGYIDPIDTYMKDAGLSVSQFNAGSMASGKYSAKQYVLPFFPDLGILYFRKDIVSAEDAAKLESGDYTYADLQAMAEQYKGQEGTTDGFVYQSSQYEGLVCNANEFTGNWQDIKGGLEEMKAMTDSANTPADILNYTEGETANSFIKGQSVFSRNWPYQWGSVKAEGTITQEQVGIAPLPNGGSVGGWLLAMNKNSANKEGAWELMKFIATEEGQKIMSTQGGYLPGFNATLEDADVVAGNEMLGMPGFQNAMTTTIARPVSAEYSKVSDALQQAIYKYLSGSADIDTTVTAVEDALKG
ncbi:extracellular solute-binding protein [Ruminococcaceae bacterium OttesenSCG-928-A16]|nr:extracellular solute-binding protein [Ruminococcaceae bacterium OttesenSCG-928-A16]